MWLEAAKQAAARGWRVFPVWWIENGQCACHRGAQCPSSGKHPRLTGWQSLATTSADQLTKWAAEYPKANLGMATGAGSEVFVLDIDVKSGGAASLLKLIKKHGWVDTLEAETGSGGSHFFFLMPRGQDIRNSASIVAPGIDVRGSGGFVVLPPSVSNKGAYTWRSEHQIVHAPEWLLASLGAKRRKKTYQDLIEGQRNEGLTSIAGSMRRQGMSEEELESSLLTVNAMAGNGLDDEEVRSIAASVARYPVDEGAEYSLTEAGNADRFFDTYGAVVRHSAGLGWVVWDGRRWVRDKKRAFNLVRRLVDDMRDEAKSSPSQFEALLKWAKECESWRRQSDIFKFVELDPRLNAEAELFDSNPWLLNVENGVLNLRDGALLPHSPDYHLTKLAPVKFNPDAECPTWDWFLNDLFDDKEVITFLQQSAGIWLTGDTSEHALWFLYGRGRNGKGAFVRAILALLGPDYAQEAAPGLLEVRNNEAHTTDIAELRGLRFLATSEVAQGRKINDARVKQLTGGDTLKGRLMRQDNFQFRPTQKLLMAGNDKPRTTDMSDGMWERMKLIRFTKQFLGGAQDRTLEPRIHRELPGILNWALAGLHQWLALPNGLVTPPSIAAETLAYKEELDTLGTFLRECTEVCPGRSIGKGKLYERYVNWAGANTEKAVSNREFTATLRERGLQEGRNAQERVWEGITPITPGRKHGD